jgi:hypothetical protein
MPSPHLVELQELTEYLEECSRNRSSAELTSERAGLLIFVLTNLALCHLMVSERSVARVLPIRRPRVPPTRRPRKGKEAPPTGKKPAPPPGRRKAG